MVENTNNYDSTFFISECALCRQSLDPQDLKSFFAVSPCSPDPTCARWDESESTLYVGDTAADRTIRIGELPNVYLVHRCCNEIVSATNNRRSLFDCCRALRPVLLEPPIHVRHWRWPLSCTAYAPVLRDIISGTADLDPVRNKVELRLEIFRKTTERLPAELVTMILVDVPFELALTLDYLAHGKQHFCNLRQDPIVCRLERASHVLKHEPRVTKPRHSLVKLEEKMSVQFLKIGGCWYLQDICPDDDQRKIGQMQNRRIQRMPFIHDHNRAPYIAVQVNEFGITHIGFDSEAGRVKWISPNKADKQADFFHDRGSQDCYDLVSVTYDVRSNHCFLRTIY
jgi:hypothetical protein